MNGNSHEQYFQTNKFVLSTFEFYIDNIWNGVQNGFDIFWIHRVKHHILRYLFTSICIIAQKSVSLARCMNYVLEQKKNQHFSMGTYFCIFRNKSTYHY